MNVILAKSAGFCFGVRRAVNICEKTAEQCAEDSTCARCVTLGPIIHNSSVTDKLEKTGVAAVDSTDDVLPGDTVIIRSHGARRDELDALKRSGVKLVDATCPDVAKIHEIVRSESAEGRIVLIIGQKQHPEVEAILSWAQTGVVIETLAELDDWLVKNPAMKNAPISVVFQTTNTRDVFEQCAERVKKECTNSKIFDTICFATCKRQEEAKAISRHADAIIVIGGKASANSLKLAEICRANCRRVYFVETADELDASDFDESDTVGITAGASTPAWIIKEVCQMMSEEMNLETTGSEDEMTASEATQEQESQVSENTADTQSEEAPAAEEEVKTAETESVQEAGEADEDQDETFAEMLERSIKTLDTGEKVTGIVAAITPTEISVDLGTKQSGYIPLNELSDDPTVNIDDIIKVGEPIETFVMRVNDVEGTVMLSKKRLDSIKNWDSIDTAREDKETVEGIVKEENKGGIVVSVKGVRVFVPASQTGVPKGQPMTPLVRTKVRLRITEVNQSRRRVVGSIRAVTNEERREKMEKIWEEIDVGMKYQGVVKSMTSYGAFVDIGGIDGMVHVSELSWTRINQPSDVLSIGDEVEVYVIGFDKEKRKISLGYKKQEDNPWEKFSTNFQIGDRTTVKIVKLMPFGAFAEILPGVDGLIHISQITDHRIGLPSEVLQEGMLADVKITDIDNEKHKVSLSIRALLNDGDTMDTVLFAAEYDEQDEPADETAEDVEPETVEETADEPTDEVAPEAADEPAAEDEDKA